MSGRIGDRTSTSGTSDYPRHCLTFSFPSARGASRGSTEQNGAMRLVSLLLESGTLLTSGRRLFSPRASAWRIWMTVKFRSPPVTELVIGVYFSREHHAVRAEHIGLF